MNPLKVVGDPRGGSNPPFGTIHFNKLAIKNPLPS